MQQETKPNFWALTPLIIFLSIYLVASVIMGDFYKMPITVAFLVASIVAVATSSGGRLHKRIDLFCKGAANSNIMLMVWIFILAGAFAQTAKAVGAVDATVNLALSVLPDTLLLAGMFIAACFISLSMGTSVGTIVALTPVAVGIATQTDLNTPFMVAIVVGGAMFGDNLSFISDTTIVATRTQGCNMKDKFKVNSLIVIPVAILITIIYLFQGSEITTTPTVTPIEWIKVIPYILVLTTALVGVNVMIVLLLGILCSGIVGIITGSIQFWEWIAAIGTGISGMGELIIITLLAGGMLEMIRYNGGIAYIIQKLTTHVKSKTKHRRPCQFCRFMHGQQHDSPHHVRPHSQRHCQSFWCRSPEIRQPVRHLLVFRARHHSLRGTITHGRRPSLHYPASHHAVPLLPVLDGCGRPFGYILSLSPEILTVNF